MKALVLESKRTLSIRDIEINEILGPYDVRIEINTVGICGSDVHYYTDGAIGPFIVNEPLVLGHEASGRIVEVGSQVKNLKMGDRVTMEPGIPDSLSLESRLGIYNLDPAVKFWATPPVHGVLRPTVVHPANLTFKLPDNVSYEEGAMIEPLAVGIYAIKKAEIGPGDIALVIGAGPIGLLTALAALSSGCSKVILSDIQNDKLELAKQFDSILTINPNTGDLLQQVKDITEGIGVDVIFECSGSVSAYHDIFSFIRPLGKLVIIGLPGKVVPFSVEDIMIKECLITAVFRYAHVFPRAIQLISSGKINVAPLVTNKFSFNESIKAFEYVASCPSSCVKAHIKMF